MRTLNQNNVNVQPVSQQPQQPASIVRVRFQGFIKV